MSNNLTSIGNLPYRLKNKALSAVGVQTGDVSSRSTVEHSGSKFKNFANCFMCCFWLVVLVFICGCYTALRYNYDTDPQEVRLYNWLRECTKFFFLTIVQTCCVECWRHMFTGGEYVTAAIRLGQAAASFYIYYWKGIEHYAKLSQLRYRYDTSSYCLEHQNM